MRRAQTVQLLSLLCLLSLELSGQLNLTLMVIFCDSSVGLNSMVFPNGNQLVMEMFRGNGGTAAAALGASQFGVRALASALVALGTGHGPLGLILTMISAFVAVS